MGIQFDYAGFFVFIVVAGETLGEALPGLRRFGGLCDTGFNYPAISIASSQGSFVPKWVVCEIWQVGERLMLDPLFKPKLAVVWRELTMHVMQLGWK